MKYQGWYDALMARARGRTLGIYKERHHVVPRALGGSDDPKNLVDLTYREHFIAHWLLTRMHVGRDRAKMLYAVNAMTMTFGGRVVAGWQVETAKRLLKQEAVKRLEARRAARVVRQQATKDRAIRAIALAPSLSIRDKGVLAQLSIDLLAAYPVRKGRKRPRRKQAGVSALVFG